MASMDNPRSGPENPDHARGVKRKTDEAGLEKQTQVPELIGPGNRIARSYASDDIRGTRNICDGSMARSQNWVLEPCLDQPIELSVTVTCTGIVAPGKVKSGDHARHRSLGRPAPGEVSPNSDHQSNAERSANGDRQSCQRALPNVGWQEAGQTCNQQRGQDHDEDQAAAQTQENDRNAENQGKRDQYPSSANALHITPSLQGTQDNT